MTLQFFTTAGCHLCEQAKALLDILCSQHEVEIETIDISTSEELVEKYGIRIPVVLNPQSKEEIGWPFSYEDLVNLV